MDELAQKGKDQGAGDKASKSPDLSIEVRRSVSQEAIAPPEAYPGLGGGERQSFHSMIQHLMQRGPPGEL